MKRLLLIAIVAGVMVVALGWWHHRRQLLAGLRADAAEAAAVEAALQEQIDTTDFAGTDQPWGEVLDILKSRCNMPLVVNEAEATAMGVDRQTRVTVPEGVIPLDELLDEITGRMDLSWRRAGDRIEITSYDSADTARNKLITRVYPLPAGTATGGKLAEDAETMYDLITTSIEPDSWDDVGGDGVIVPAGGALVIRQTAEIHRIISAFLARMTNLPDGPPRHFPIVEISAADAAAERALSRKVHVDFRSERLDFVLNQLSQKAGVPIRLGDQSIARAPIRLHSAANDSLRSTLQQIFTQIGLSYCIRHGAILITTDDDVQSHPSIWFYDVGDLVGVDGGSDFDTLIDLLTDTVEPDSWDEVGGPGTIQELGDHWLVVVQSRDNHRKLQRTLARIRAHLEPGIDPAGDLPLDPIDDVAPAIHQALRTDVTLKYVSRQLRDVCADLSQQLLIPVIPRQAFLADADISLEMPLTCDLPPLPLRHALAILLDEHKLTFDPRGEVLYVTTPEDAESELVTRIIDVRHLLGTGGGGFDEDTIFDLVTTCVAPDSWDELGGPGSQENFRGLLVFRQTYDISRQVQELIDALSEHCLPAPTPLADASVAAGRQQVWISLSAGEQSLLEKLETPVSVNTKGVRVRDAIGDLCRQASIPVHYDRLWYEEARLENATFTLDLSFDKLPLREVLAQIQERKAVGFAVSHGMLLVTDPEAVASHTLRRLYPLRLPKMDDVPQHAYQVADMLAERLESDTWGTNGGYGVVEPVNDEWLLVVQTLPMHRRVEEALAKFARGEILPLPAHP